MSKKYLEKIKTKLLMNDEANKNKTNHEFLEIKLNEQYLSEKEVFELFDFIKEGSYKYPFMVNVAKEYISVLYEALKLDPYCLFNLDIKANDFTAKEAPVLADILKLENCPVFLLDQGWRIIHLYRP